jgi:succinylarginine dihydrolase
VDVPGAGTWLLCARECEETPRAWALVQRWIADPAVPIDGVRVFDLRQSMRNGGGPACLRLRVVLTPAQRAAVHRGAWLDAARHAELVAWVERHYRDRLDPQDLADPQLLQESRTALDRLTRILGLGDFYAFQR